MTTNEIYEKAVRLDEMCGKYFSTYDEGLIYEICMECNKQGLHAFKMKFLEKVKSLIPYNRDVHNGYADILYMMCQYKEALEEYILLLDTTINENMVKTYNEKVKLCIPHIKGIYTEYNKAKVDEIVKRKNGGSSLITFSITTCKRFELFCRTMNSFLECCLDSHLIGEWICVDDNSSPQDREKMKELYPFFTFIFKTEGEKGHYKSMNIIREKVKTPYLFHIEDDWEFFIKREFLGMCLKIITDKFEFKQVLINRNYRETENDMVNGGMLGCCSLTFSKYYVHEYCKDTVQATNFLNKYGKLETSYWPHFSFRPSLIKTSIFHDVGEFRDVPNFERDYGLRYCDQNHISCFLEGISCLHIGRLCSDKNGNVLNSYSLNNTRQMEETDAEKNERKNHKMRLIENGKGLVDSGFSFKKLENNKLGVFTVDIKAFVPEKTSAQLQRIFEYNPYKIDPKLIGKDLAHLSALMDFLESGKEMALVVENGCFPLKNFEKKFSVVLGRVNPGWNMIYLGMVQVSRFITPETFEEERLPELHRINVMNQLTYSRDSAFAYVITREGAKKFLEYIEMVSMADVVDVMFYKFSLMASLYYPDNVLVVNTRDDIEPPFLENGGKVAEESFLYVPAGTRLTRDLGILGNFKRIYDENEVLKFEGTESVLYSASLETVLRMLDKIKLPKYTISNHLIIVPDEKIGDKVFIDCLKREGKYDIGAVFGR